MCSLGYFVDILDLFLFSTLRVPSLKSLGLNSEQLVTTGVSVLNAQLVGLLLGGFFWGILGDKVGRLKALYGSIFIYSTATLLNAFINTPFEYGLCRFVAGFGLAGELGTAITFISEIMPKEKRGLGTTLVAGVGLSGGIFSGLIAENFDWRTCYIIGGSLGFVLLLLRMQLSESQLFLDQKNTKKGNLFILFKSPDKFLTFLKLIIAGMPIYFVAGILMIFSPEISKNLGITGSEITAAKAVLFSYVGVSLGDFLCGLLSQKLKSRKKPILFFLVGVAVFSFWILLAKGVHSTTFYTLCFLVGISTGYWVVLITSAAESFGTNVRATVTTAVPNLIRASLIPMTWIFKSLYQERGVVQACILTGCTVLILSFLVTLFIKDTFSKDLSFKD